MPQIHIVSFNSGQNTVHVIRGNRVHHHSYTSVISILVHSHPKLDSSPKVSWSFSFYTHRVSRVCTACLSTQQKTPLWMWGHMEVVYSSVWPRSVAPTPEAPLSLILLLRKGFHITIIPIACCHRNTLCYVFLHFSLFPPMQHRSTSLHISSLPE